MSQVKRFRYESALLTEEVRQQQEGAFISLAEGVTHYEWDGPEGGPVVVLVHGLTTPYFVWDETVKVLRDGGFRVLRYDLYGRGFSDRPDTRYDLGLYERQLLNLLDALEITEPIYLVGLSMGGAISTHVAAIHPHRIEKVALLAPAGVPTNAPKAAGLAMLPGLGEGIMALLGNQIVLNGFRKAFVHSTPSEAFMDLFREQMVYKGFRRAILSSLRHVPLQDMGTTYQQLAETKLPVLLLWGDDDKVVPMSSHTYIQAWLPDVIFEAIDNAGHQLHMEQPEAVHSRLLAFLRA